MAHTMCSCVLLAVILLAVIKGADAQGVIPKQPTYAIVAPTKIRPNQDVVVAATILKLELSDTFTIRAVIRYLVSDTHAEEICGDEYTFIRTGTHKLILQTPPSMQTGNYTIRVTGFGDKSLEGLIFTNETKIFYESKQISVFIQTNKPYYNQNQKVLIRVIPIYPNAMPVTTSMDVSIKDTNGIKVREWFSLHTNAGGVVTLTFPLNSNNLAFGNKWSINVHCMEHTYTKYFDVYEFYPPLFFVNVSVPTYMFRHSIGLPVLVTSTMGNLCPIKGNATVKLEVLDINGKTIAEIAPIIEPVREFDHRASVEFNIEELEEHVGGGANGLIGKQLKVSATVFSWDFRTSASGFASTIVYSEKIQLSFLGGEVWSFKPNIPFKIYVAAQRLDKSAIDPYLEDRNIELSITTTEEDTGERTVTELVPIPPDTSVVEYLLSPTSHTEQITVSAAIPGELSTEKRLVATRHWSPTNSYLHISTTTSKPAVGNYIIFTLQTNVFVDVIYYYIVSAGNIVASESIQMYARSKLFSVAVSREMAPTSTIVAFFMSPDGQVAADSLQFHVDGTKLHNMKVRFNRGKDLNYDSIEITAWADPLSYVVFSALEYHMYHLGIRNGLSWDQVNQELYTYSNHTNSSIVQYFKKDGQTVNTFTASTPSYAHDANSTFFFSGLYIFTDANVSSVFTACNMTKGEYPCMDGKSCYNWQQVCNQAVTCTRDHRDEMGCHRNESAAAVLYEIGGWERTKRIGAFYRDGAFMWTEQFTKPDGRIDIKIKPPTFDVSWVLSGFAMSRESGLSILPGLNIFTSGRPMYIHVSGAKKMRLGEVISLRVVVFNLWTEELDVLLSIKASKDFNFMQVDRDTSAISGASEVNGEHQVLVPVRPGSHRMIYIPIKLSKTGNIAIPVKAMCFAAGHTVTHKVSVGYDAVADRNITNYQVDLRVANSMYLPDLWLPVEENAEGFELRWKNYIPGSPKSYITVIGDIIGISFFPYTDFNLATSNLIAQPSGCGAEALFNVGINLNALNMMRSLGTLAYDKVTKVTDSLNLGLQDMFAYRTSDGSFKEFGDSFAGSTWVSAIALKVMTSGVKAKELRNDFQMPQDRLNETANWLLMQQDEMGRFIENDVVLNRRFESKVDITFPNGTVVPANLALTALCLTALSQGSTATSLSNSVITSVSLGAGYLDKYYKDITDPFEMAIVTYAMFVTGINRQHYKALEKLRSMKKTVSGMIYWSSEDVAAIEQAESLDRVVRLEPKSTGAATAYTVAATSYALLSYMQSISRGDERELLDPIQRFLQEQHMWVGGFASSQDTLVAVQALTELADRDQNRHTYDMTFTFKSDQDPNWVKVVHLNRDNWFDLQKFETPSHWGSIQTQARGHGLALVQMETIQNFENREQIAPPPVPNIFDLGNFNYDIRTKGFNHSIITYKICPRYNGISGKSGMAVLEVNVPTGYQASAWGIKKYVTNNKATTSLRAAEFNNREVAVFYYDYLNSSSVNCVEFSAFRWFPVSTMAELTGIKVYEYYEPGNYFSSMYEKVEMLKLTVCLACGSYQCPYCPFYNSATVHSPNIYILLVSIMLTIFVHTCTYLH